MSRFFLILTFALFSSINVFACSCIEENISLSQKIKKAYTNSEGIFIGKVIQIKQKKNSSLLEVTFEIESFFKGNTNKKIIKIATEQDGAMCGYNFSSQKKYIVYTGKTELDRKKNSFESIKVPVYYTTGLCTRTNNIKSVKKCELRKLKKLAKRNKN